MFLRAGIGVFVVAALGILGAGIGVFVVAALGFLWSWHWVFECRHWCFCDSRLVASVRVDSVLESQLIGPPASITTCPALTFESP